MPKTPAKKTASHRGLMITRAADGVLSPAQVNFNRLMKQLESARTKHFRETARLDGLLVVSRRDLMPLIDDLHRANRDMIFKSVDALRELKFNARRRSALEELVCGKAVDLLSDSCGLTTEDVERLETIVTELEKPAAEEPPDPGDVEECNYLRKMLEKIAREDGLELDLSDVDPTMHPADFEQEIERRFQAAAAAGTDFGPPLRPRKQTKAQLEKQRKLEEQEAAKKCDFKSLYKQLAKALHPDLEPDPLLKQHKEVWMKRLTGAYAAGDLRELLQIEMEWLGEEATNLATASEGKLQVYCTVLKQQIADLKQQTGYLLREPQYGTLRRFIDPFFGTMLSTAEIISDLRKELRRHRSMVKALTDGEPHRRAMMEQWADDHRQSLRQPTFHF